MSCKKIKIGLCFLIALLILSCASKSKTGNNKPLYEILTQQDDGGATIRFFEILNESKEIKMLLNDSNLRKKISQEDIQSCNFIILNAGEKKSYGYGIIIKSIKETTDKIIIQTEEVIAKKSTVLSDEEYVYPYTIVKINSKKEIEIN
jgi:hypothetical protein